MRHLGGVIWLSDPDWDEIAGERAGEIVRPEPSSYGRHHCGSGTGL